MSTGVSVVVPSSIGGRSVRSGIGAGSLVSTILSGGEAQRVKLSTELAVDFA